MGLPGARGLHFPQAPARAPVPTIPVPLPARPRRSRRLPGLGLALQLRRRLPSGAQAVGAGHRHGRFGAGDRLAERRLPAEAGQPNVSRGRGGGGATPGLPLSLPLLILLLSPPRGGGGAAGPGDSGRRIAGYRGVALPSVPSALGRRGRGLAFLGRTLPAGEPRLLSHRPELSHSSFVCLGGNLSPALRPTADGGGRGRQWRFLQVWALCDSSSEKAPRGEGGGGGQKGRWGRESTGDPPPPRGLRRRVAGRGCQEATFGREWE